MHGKKSLQDKDVRLWASVEAYQKFMTGQKHAILAAIYRHQPQSVYQLAKILNRAPQNVARDCSIRAGHKFIKFVESKDGRKTKAPPPSGRGAPSPFPGRDRMGGPPKPGLSLSGPFLAPIELGPSVL